MLRQKIGKHSSANTNDETLYMKKKGAPKVKYFIYIILLCIPLIYFAGGTIYALIQMIDGTYNFEEKRGPFKFTGETAHYILTSIAALISIMIIGWQVRFAGAIIKNKKLKD